ncbi:MAG: hypothetical protein MI924_13400 [Chloroflexales bacterium]|nr:hypothetical protein [Chloroflexales bacterium]
MAKKNGEAPPALGELGRELVMRRLDQLAGEPVQALAGMLASAYGALLADDVDTARTVLGGVLAPARDLERALVTLHQAQRAALTCAETLANVAPPVIGADLAFSAETLAAWRQALEASVAAQIEVIERLRIVQQLALAAAPPPLSV